MYVHLVFNRSAGLAEHGELPLLMQLRQQGHYVEPLQPRKQPPDPRCNLILVAGGDGTVAKSVRRLCHTGIPLTLVPLGTANNIACSLGVQAQTQQDIVSVHGEDLPPLLSLSHHQQLSLGQVKAAPVAATNAHKPPERLFVESVGGGLLTQLMKLPPAQSPATFSNRQHELRYRAGLARTLLQTLSAKYYELVIDGVDYSGEYLMLEIMNMPRTGPGLLLAPSLPTDAEEFEVVLVPPEDKRKLSHYLARAWQSRNQGHTAPADGLFRVRGKHIQLRGQAPELHIDDKVQNGEGEHDYAVNAGACGVDILH